MENTFIGRLFNKSILGLYCRCYRADYEDITGVVSVPRTARVREPKQVSTLPIYNSRTMRRPTTCISLLVLSTQREVIPRKYITTSMCYLFTCLIILVNTTMICDTSFLLLYNLLPVFISKGLVGKMLITNFFQRNYYRKKSRSTLLLTVHFFLTKVRLPCRSHTYSNTTNSSFMSRRPRFTGCLSHHYLL